MKHIILTSLLLLSWSIYAKDINLTVTPTDPVFNSPLIKFKLKTAEHIDIKEVRVYIMSDARPPVKIKEKDFEVQKVAEREWLLKMSHREVPAGKYSIDVMSPPSGLLGKLFNKNPVAKGSTSFVVGKGPIVVFGDPQPPHPGEAGEQTLLGIDSDKDGVRDDIEIWINERFEGQENLIKAMKQYAQTYQEGLKVAHDKEASIKATHDSFRAANCIRWIIGIDEETKIDKEFMFNFLNTKERIKMKMAASKNFHGQGLPEDLSRNYDNKKIFCKFEIKE